MKGVESPNRIYPRADTYVETRGHSITNRVRPVFPAPARLDSPLVARAQPGASTDTEGNPLLPGPLT